MSMPLLPQQIAPVDDRQAALTARHLSPILDTLMEYFLARRVETDAALAPRLGPAAGKPYPYGRCEEITRDLFARLARRLEAPTDGVERILRDFVVQGGVVRSVWGVLRGQYFQNAIQFGGLYVDVSNDTVVITKPKVEILPLAECGLAAVRDLAHFRATAEAYWNADVYANHLLPSLAPLLPMVTESRGRLQPWLQSACDYMIALMCRDGFRQAEDWLLHGPAPPSDVADALFARVPADLRPRTSDRRAESVAACRWARDTGCDRDPGWRDVRVMEYLRFAGRAETGSA